uniref:Fe2OG dioxygenase domain-containing protein n=1 Tax=Aegilops tauschii subsp. strangulata TaxID=200361 RepID=A0A453AA41_AEGTS
SSRAQDTSTTSAMSAAYDRTADLRALDATCSGVRGLAASGITQLPRIFRVPDHHHESPPPQALFQESPSSAASIPVIDLGGPDRAAVVAAVRRAAAEWGFFQVTGHGVPLESMAAATDATRGFHEADGCEGSDKARLYSREPARAVKYHCNFDLYQSPVANWRDTLYLRMAPDPPDAGDLPDSCRNALFEYAEQVKNLGSTLFKLLSEALGLKPSYLTDIECNQGQIILCHYYPPCPQPELAIGTSRHSDSGFLTILLQDEIGGLQILHEDRWVDVTPTPGAFIVNIGDLLQLISNDGFRSVEHRVVAKNAAPRVSIACFFSTHFHPASTRMYGPIKELLSDENPPLYRETLVRDYIKHYYSIGLDAKTAISDFRL